MNNGYCRKKRHIITILCKILNAGQYKIGAERAEVNWGPIFLGDVELLPVFGLFLNNFIVIQGRKQHLLDFVLLEQKYIAQK